MPAALPASPSHTVSMTPAHKSASAAVSRRVGTLASTTMASSAVMHGMDDLRSSLGCQGKLRCTAALPTSTRLSSLADDFAASPDYLVEAQAERHQAEVVEGDVHSHEPARATLQLTRQWERRRREKESRNMGSHAPTHARPFHCLVRTPRCSLRKGAATMMGSSATKLKAMWAVVRNSGNEKPAHRLQLGLHWESWEQHSAGQYTWRQEHMLQFRAGAYTLALT